MPQRILLLMADTGGGHRSSAEATMEALQYRYSSNVDVKMVDVLRGYAPFPFSRLDTMYPYMIRYGVEIWEPGYQLLNSPKRAQRLIRAFWPMVRRAVRQVLVENPADLIVSFHSLFNYAVLWGMQREKITTPLVTVVTDLVTIHALWCAPGATRYIMPTQMAARRARTFGVPPERMVVTGLPISLRFSQALARTKAEVRAELGLRQDKKVALVMGGGQGMGGLDTVAEAVATSGADLQIVVVAGRNEKLRQQLEQARWPVPKLIFGFTRDIPLLMRAADVIVTKAGPSTIAEALACGLPIILSGYIPGQEDGNRLMVVRGGAGVYAPKPNQIAATVREWFAPGSAALETCAAAAQRLGRPDAALHVAEALYQVLNREIAISVEEARRYYDMDDPAHDFDHVLRVTDLAVRIAEAEGADVDIVRAAALLHDIERKQAEARGLDHAEHAAARAREILAGYPQDKVEAVAEAIRAHRFRTDPPPRTLEAQALFDADKLDAIGAVGVARAFAYGGHAGQRLWAPIAEDYVERWKTGRAHSDEHTPFHEYVVKLSRLTDQMYTPTGQQIAAQRRETMQAFFEQLAREMTGQA